MVFIFMKIIKGEIFFYKIVEDDCYYVFLDIWLFVKGYMFVVFKQEVDYFFDVEDELLGGVMIFVKWVAKVLEFVIDCKWVGVMVIGIEVLYVYIYFIFFQKEV